MRRNRATTAREYNNAPLKTRVEIIDSTRPAFLASPLADARGYGSHLHHLWWASRPMLAPLRSRPYIPVAMVARRPVTAATVAAAAPGVDFSGSVRRHRDGMLVQDSAEGSVLQIFGGEVFVCPQNAVIGR